MYLKAKERAYQSIVKIGTIEELKNGIVSCCYIQEAEDEGFKPPIPKKGIPDFESSAFGHSANLPNLPCKSKHNSAISKILDHLIL